MSRTFGTTAFVALTAVAAASLLLAAGLPADPRGTMLLWFLACVAGEALWIRTPTKRGIISMALTIDVAALFTLGPAGSLTVITLSTLLAGIYPHRRPWFKVIFNAAQSTLATAAALSVLALLAKQSDPSAILDVRMTWLPLFAAGLTYYLVNTALVSCAIGVSSGTSIWRAWRDNFGYGFELWCTLAQISLSGFVLAAYQQIGPVSVLALLPVLGVLWWSSAREANARAQSTPESSNEPDRLKLAG